MSNSHTISEGGLAHDVDGKPADMPRDLAGSLSGDLMDVTALLHSARLLASEADGDNWQLIQILSMADRKLDEVTDAFLPYL